MIDVAEAHKVIFKHLVKLEDAKVPIDKSVGMVLNESIVADRDFPPFDRVMMDGITLDSNQLNKGERIFPVQEMQPAGVPKRSLVDPANCIEIMTGAVLPEGCNVVIRYEDVDIRGQGDKRTASIKTDKFREFQNIHRRGEDRKEGSVIIKKGRLISPAEVGIMATVGMKDVSVKSWPPIAVVSSGDELVEVGQVPAPHQIRQSNSYSLMSACSELGIKAKRFHLADKKEEIRTKLDEVFSQHKIVILSGGVSKGKKDYIPEILEEKGIRKLFHRVKQRPGKPFWFGISDAGIVVFALPGNPVSSFMNFYRYIKPWLYTSGGINYKPLQASLTEDFTFEPPLTYFLQVKVTNKEGRLAADPVVGGGSGDLANLVDAHGFLELPSGRSTFEKGEVFDYFPFRPLFGDQL